MPKKIILKLSAAAGVSFALFICHLEAADTAVEKPRDLADSYVSELKNDKAQALPDVLPGAYAKEAQAAEITRDSIEINGDTVQYSAQSSEMTAKGNVVVVYKDTILTCDSVSVNTQTKDCVADGSVQIKMKGDEMVIKAAAVLYNFDTKKGTFVSSKLHSDIMYAGSAQMKRESVNHFVMDRAYFSTCSFDHPHYRGYAGKMDMYPGDRMIARDFRMQVQDKTLLRIPKYLHWLDRNRPRVSVTPGYSKEWGMFTLTSWKYYFNEYIKGWINIDYRDRKNLAWGPEVDYKTKSFGKGAFNWYYMNERNLLVKSTFVQKFIDPRVTTERERFRVWWRHKWDPDEDTQVYWQYDKKHEPDIMKDYFKNEYVKNLDNDTYLLAARNIGVSNLSFYTRARVNQYESALEKLPEIAFTTPENQVGGSPVYFLNTSTFSNLNQKYAVPRDELDESVTRFDTTNQFSLPSKVFVFEFKPFVSSRQTYYNRGLNGDERNFIRTAFSPGGSLSTKFFRIFEVNTDKLGLNINRLRHVVTPTASYTYIHKPTVGPGKLLPLDSVDSVNVSNAVSLELTNKLQTKRINRKGGKPESVDLAIFRVSAPYTYHPKGTGSTFGDLRYELELLPYKWLSFDVDAVYGHQRPYGDNQYFKTVDLDMFVQPSRYTKIGVGQRYQRKDYKEFTGEITQRINPKWKIGVLERYEFSRVTKVQGLSEQEYRIIRDLHCWEWDFTYQVKRGQGEAIWMIFHLKAFPEMSMQVDRSYHRRKTGSQSPGVE